MVDSGDILEARFIRNSIYTYWIVVEGERLIFNERLAFYGLAFHEEHLKFYLLDNIDKLLYL